ncbi:MAG: prephenate dehydrogenase [Bacteroidetes bacterium]|nr:MAG: prephenate dehydrogenase [Bacteroidota bacterium]
MTITIIGIGLVGGSMALDLKNRGFAHKIIGVDNNLNHQNVALLSKIVDEVDSLESAVHKADLIIIATPIDAIQKLLPKILDLTTGSSKVVTDAGSTKAGICRLVENHPNREHYVASHPMAGTEYSGPMAAVSRLFDYKNAIICDKEKSSKPALRLVKKMYDTLNMKLIYMNSKQHDVSAAYVSHMSHISSFVLSLAVLEKEQNEKRILNLASGGFASTVRLAKSSAEMWVPVFEQNSTYILEVIETYMDKLQAFKTAIENNDDEKLKNLITQANHIQKIL